jgi:hypothetical protein
MGASTSELSMSNLKATKSPGLAMAFRTLTCFYGFVEFGEQLLMKAGLKATKSPGLATDFIMLTFLVGW